MTGLDRKQGRLLLVDGLRGIAAMMVVVQHLHEAVSDVSGDWIWPELKRLFGMGFLGVDLFFVISGFVISYSVRNYEHSPAFLLRFGLRRSVRLDPPYWATIAMELLAIKAGLLLFPALNTDVPSIQKVIANVFYVQNLLGYGDVVPIFWTLCYEVQFYLVLVGTLVLARAARKLWGGAAASTLMFAVAVSAFSASVLIFFGPLRVPDGVFLDRWFQFFLGVLAMKCVAIGRVTPAFAAAWMLVILGASLSDGHSEIGYTTALVSLLLVTAGLMGKMGVWLSGQTIQFLGKISYSLYLLHSLVGWRLIKLLAIWNGSPLTPMRAWVVFALGCLASILSAWVMHRMLEGPALRLCHRISLDKPLGLKDRARIALSQWRDRSS